MKIWGMVEQIFGWLVQTSAHAAVITVMVLLAQFLLRKRLSPAWRYGLWFLLVARLLMPTTPRSSVSVFNLARWPQPSTAASIIAAEPSPAVDTTIRVVSAPFESPRQPAVGLVRSEAATTPVVGAPVPHPNQRVQPAAHQLINWKALAAGVWAGGLVLLGLRFACIELRFRRRLALGRPLQDPALKCLLNEGAQILGLNHDLPVFETEEVQTPAVYGLWRKRLLLPDGLRERLSKEGLRHVLMHELAHVKRRDPEANWLIAVLQILHWFNPLLWIAFARMRADRELATDDLALKHTGLEDRSSYGETILQVLEGVTRRASLPGLVGIGESKAQMKERLRAIRRGVGPRWRWAAAAVTAVIAGLTLTNAREGAPDSSLDLLKHYPTKLTVGDAVPSRARPWEFTAQDIFQVRHFKFQLGQQLRVELGSADLGIGHCGDGAVWAVLLPRENGKLLSPASTNEESVVHVWLRFHPNQISRLFPPDTVTSNGRAELEDRIRQIAEAKLGSSWHAGNRVMIPSPPEMTVDVDTAGGLRRFFAVDTLALRAQYIAAFANRPFESHAEPLLYEPEFDTNCARVISVVPANGATVVESRQDLRLRFDRPMDPHSFKLQWLAGGGQLAGPIRVSADQTEFAVPVHLTPGEQKLVLNRDQEREQWIAFGRRPEMKPPGSRRVQSGFVDEHGVAANEFRWSFSVTSVLAKPGARKPRVVSVSPPSGATTPVLTTVEITFDQPMRPPEQGLPYLQQSAFLQGPSLLPSIECDATAKRFRFPVLLRADDDVRLTLRGFYSTEGVACDPVVLHYQTGTDSLDSSYTQRAKAAAQDPNLQRILAEMQQARARLNSGIETVQTIRLGMSKSSFTSVESQTATFKWQGEGQVYADLSGPMMTKAFIMGSNGRDCWLYSEDEKAEKRLDQTPAAITERNVLLLDPFDLQNRPVEEALANGDLVYGHEAALEGKPCYHLEKWEVNQDNVVWASLTQWWIDEQTFLPRQIVQYYPSGCEIVRFEYAGLNESIPDSAFQPPTTSPNEAHPLFFQNPPQAGERRFLRICDGSNGRMSGRFGWQGANGTTSSGLN